MIRSQSRSVKRGSASTLAGSRSSRRQPGKALRGVQLLALVDDGELEAEALADRGRCLGNVARAEQIQPQCGLDRLDEDLHPAAAAHAQVLTEVFDEQLRFAGGERGRERLFDELLDGTAADTEHRLRRSRRAMPPPAAREQHAEPADHSHLPAFLLRPVRARG